MPGSPATKPRRDRPAGRVETRAHDVDGARQRRRSYSVPPGSGEKESDHASSASPAHRRRGVAWPSPARRKRQQAGSAVLREAPGEVMVEPFNQSSTELEDMNILSDEGEEMGEVEKVLVDGERPAGRHHGRDRRVPRRRPEGRGDRLGSAAAQGRGRAGRGDHAHQGRTAGHAGLGRATGARRERSGRGPGAGGHEQAPRRREPPAPLLASRTRGERVAPGLARTRSTVSRRVREAPWAVARQNSRSRPTTACQPLSPPW